MLELQSPTLFLFLVVSGKPREYPIFCKYPQQITSVQERLGPDRKSPTLTTGFTNDLFPRYRQYLHHHITEQVKKFPTFMTLPGSLQCSLGPSL